MQKILIDTDVLLDFFFDRQPFSEDSSKVLNLCEINKIQGFVTPVIISNVYYLLRKTAHHEKVIEKLIQLLTFIDILLIDKFCIEKALSSEFKDFEDALQNFAAENNSEINAIITRNVKDFKKSNLPIFTPENYIKIIV